MLYTSNVHHMLCTAYAIYSICFVQHMLCTVYGLTSICYVHHMLCSVYQTFTVGTTADHTTGYENL